MKQISWYLALVLCLWFGFESAAQQQDPMLSVSALFDAMRRADSAALESLFWPRARLRTAGKPEEILSPKDFAASIAGLKAGEADERLGRARVSQDAGLAQVWVPYHFYFRGQFSHCGFNAFELRADENGRWLISGIIDTRRKSDCPEIADEPVLQILDSLMNSWHRSAATANAEAFFGLMSEDGIYLGTDATERWLRDSMAVWAAPYFARGKAWDFKPKERHWYLSDDGATAWFEEHLDSWMGEVRGSGVMSRSELPGQKWELRHYNLALTIPNDDMKSVIELLSGAVPAKD